MRKIAVLAILAALGVPAFAGDKEEDRLRDAGEVLQEIMGIPEGVPQELLDKAECVVVLPSVKKFAIGLGGSYGRGAMVCRSGAEFKGKWSVPVMIALEGGSFGFQLGGQATDFVLLLMSPRSATAVLRSKVKLGADISAAAGPKGRAASAETDASFRAEILTYSRSRGLFAGVSLSGSTLRADKGANQNLYNRRNVNAERLVQKPGPGNAPNAALLVNVLNKKSPKNLSDPESLKHAPER